MRDQKIGRTTDPVVTLSDQCLVCKGTGCDRLREDCNCCESCHGQGRYAPVDEGDATDGYQPLSDTEP